MEKDDQIWVGSLDADRFEPLTFEGESIGRIHTIRESVRHERKTWIGLWDIGPAEILDFTSPADETFVVLAGTLLVTGRDFEQKLGEGRVVSLEKGVAVDLRFLEPSRLFFSISEDDRVVYPG